MYFSDWLSYRLQFFFFFFDIWDIFGLRHVNNVIPVFNEGIPDAISSSHLLCLHLIQLVVFWEGQKKLCGKPGLEI